MKLQLIMILFLFGCTQTHTKMHVSNTASSIPGKQNKISEQNAEQNTPKDPKTTRQYMLLEYSGHTGENSLPIVKEISAQHEKRAFLNTVLAKPFLQWILQVGYESRLQAFLRCKKEKESHCHARFDQPAFFVIVKGGNRPKQGFILEKNGKFMAYPETFYVEISLKETETLIPHEYGHIILFERLTNTLPKHPRILPHTTGAITNDITAISEGWGIHLETLAIQYNLEQKSRKERKVFSSREDISKGDSLLLANDVMSYSQSYQRYHCILANCFAYLPRVSTTFAMGKIPDQNEILSRWTDTSYDPAKIRTLEQMVSSEGVLASLFYRLATASWGEEKSITLNGFPSPKRYAKMLQAFSEIEGREVEKTPLVLLFLQKLLLTVSPKERSHIAHIALEVFHYTLLIPQAPYLFQELHKAAHLVDKERFYEIRKNLVERMQKVQTVLRETPEILKSVAAPELWIRHSAFTLSVPLLGFLDVPLSFDLNTADEIFLLTIPGVSFEQAKDFVAIRAMHGGFPNWEELKKKSGFSEKTLAFLSGACFNAGIGHPKTHQTKEKNP